MPCLRRRYACIVALALATWAAPPVRAEEPAGTPLSLETHKPNYLLTTWDFTQAPGRQDKEWKLQFSFKKQLLKDWPFFFAYTQRAFWQIYDQEDSRPFRTQNHNPEVFYDLRLSPQWGGKTSLRLGMEHESNGVGVPGSRSWNLLYAQGGIDFPQWEHLGVHAKVWGRFPETKKATPTDPQGDDNPDIQDFLGYGELTLSQVSQGAKDELPYRRIALMLRHGSRANTATAQLDLEYELSDILTFVARGVYLRVQYFNGYGESLADYNRRLKKVGIGLSFY